MRIAVIGGGAAGLIASISARKNMADVTIFESNDILGKKILMTGNGKCNLTNSIISKDYYYSKNPDFVSDSLNRFGYNETINFFNGLGLLLMEKRGGIYPNSEQASAVADALINEINSLGIKVINEKVISLKKNDGLFLISSDNKEYFFDRVILATGGNAAPKTGSDGNGYRLALNIGHDLERPLPALTSLKCHGDFWREVAGVRCISNVKLLIDNKEIVCSYGELQITDYGLSGIPVFQVSRNASKALIDKKKVCIVLDFLPDLEYEDLVSELSSRILVLPDRNAFQILSGFLNKKLCNLLLSSIGVQETDALNNDVIRVLANRIKNFEVEVRAANGFDHAQTTAGGILLSQITSDFESTICDGLFFAGEIIDVDGLCGGYNLQWAWTSGHIAGEAAAKC